MDHIGSKTECAVAARGGSEERGKGRLLSPAYAYVDAREHELHSAITTSARNA